MERRLLNNYEETVKFGFDLAKKLFGGEVILLYGELGSGKTTFVKGIAHGLGMKDSVTSPTFVLMNIYEKKRERIRKLVHIDTYRLKDKKDLVEIGIFDFLGKQNTVVAIEWAEKVRNLVKGYKGYAIKLEHSKGHKRLITVHKLV